MSAEPRTLGAFALSLALLASAPATAFDPGTKTVCRPSADGTQFECHPLESTPTHAGKTDPTAATRAPRPAASAPVGPASEPASTFTPASAVKASDLPAYLRGSPAPATVGQAQSRQPIDPARADPPIRRKLSSELITPPSANQPIVQPRAATPAPAPMNVPIEREPARAAQTPATSTPTSTDVAAQPASSAPAPSRTQVQRPNGLSDIDLFRQLPAAHYTLEIGKARTRQALQAQIDSFADVSGALHVLRLGGVDGAWYLLVWSDFPTPEAAQSARSRLPATAAITSGFARRIGPLQAELAR